MPVAIKMEFNLMLALRFVQGIFSIIILGLTAHVINWANSVPGGASPDFVNFMLFCCIWTWLALAYLICARMFTPKFYHPFGVLGVEFVSVVFWFAGWVATAAKVSGLEMCRTSVCGSAKAAAAFGAFEWLAWCVTLALAIIEWNQSRGAEVEGATGNKNSESPASHTEDLEAAPQELEGTDGNRTQHNLSPVHGPIRIPSPLEYGGREV